MEVLDIISKLKSIYNTSDFSAVYSNDEKRIYLSFYGPKTIFIVLSKEDNSILIEYNSVILDKYVLSNENFIKVDASLKEFESLIYNKHSKEFQNFLNTVIVTNTEDIDDAVNN